MPLKIGIAGFGFMGKTHLGVYSDNPDAEVVAICDASAAAIKNLDRVGNIEVGGLEQVDFGAITVYTDYADFLAHDRLDIVDICLPTHLHCDHAIKAFTTNKHVICEKPISVTTEEADRMIAAAGKANKNLFIGHCIRFWPEYAWLKQAVDDKKYGAVKAAVFRRVSALPTWSSDNWLFDRKRGTNAVLDLHIHDTDFIHYLFGKPRKVYSRGTPVMTGGTDVISTHYIYDAVPVVSAFGSWGSPGGYPFEMTYTVFCEKATLEYSSRNNPTLSVYHIDGSVQQPDLGSEDGYTREIRYFLNCIKNRKGPAIITAEDAKYTLELVVLEEKGTACL